MNRLTDAPRGENRCQSLLAGAALAVVLCLGSPLADAAVAKGRAAVADEVGDLSVVDCLLPGRVRRLGRRQTYISRRRPIRTTAFDCRVRGGEYTAFDRADYASALNVWLGEATGGSAEAQYYVGQIYERGLGIEPDYESAALWYKRAAEQDHAPAQIGLGYLYEAGLGLEKDPVAALDWYRKAADLPPDYVLLESTELDDLRLAETELGEKMREIEGLEGRLGELERQLEAMRQAETEAEAEAQQEEVRLESVVEDLRRELAGRRRSASQSEARLAELEGQVERLATSTGPASEAGSSSVRFGPYHALVIGNCNYRDLPQLISAEGDAKAIARLLEEKYGFEVRLLLDATRYQIMTALNEVRESLTDADNLLIFYAGHSQRDKTGQRGWWQPIDADPVSRVNWISNQVLSDHLQLISAKHALVVADAAYQATLTRSSIPRLPRGLTAQRRDALMREMLERRTRLVLSSGALRPVAESGHSTFSSALLDILRENRGVMPASALYQRLSQLMADAPESAHAPQFAPLRWAHHEGGSDFFFVPEEEH